MEIITKKMNVTVKLPWLNKSNDKNEYKSYYTNEMKSKVEKLYIKDIQLFKYAF